MGLKASFNYCDNYANAFQHSKFTFFAEILDENNLRVEPSTFLEAEYLIGDPETGSALIRKKLGDGVRAVGDMFEITIPASEMTFEGVFDHQLVVFNQLNERLPPSIQDPLFIRKTYK